MVAHIAYSVSSASTRHATDRAARVAASRQEALLDAALVLRFNAGDETAFVEIVTRYREKMFQIAFRLLRNRADAEEIAQDTFIRAHRSLARFRGDSSLAAWLYRVAVNLSYNRYGYFSRRQRHATLPLDAAFSEGNPSTFAEMIACDAPSPVRAVANNEFVAIVTSCTDELTADHREILALRSAQHHSYDHISRTLGISIGTVKSRIARARTCLRVLLGKAYPEFTPDASPFECFEPIRSSGRLEAISA